MVQIKVPNKLGIKHHISDNTQLVNSTQSHDKLNKIMKRSDDLPLKKPPNYMKSTSSFEEQSPKTPSPSKTSSLKLTSFKPLRPSKNVILKATCSSTLKQSKFPDYLELSPGGSELQGTSAMKVCSYTYCSLNGHYHAPLQPLKCFMSAGRRALKTKPHVKKNEDITPKLEEKEESLQLIISSY